MQPINIGSCGASGAYGPNASMCADAYANSTFGNYITMGAPAPSTVNNSWQVLTLPEAGMWNITIAGGCAQNNVYPAFGRGAILTYIGYFPFNYSLYILVGQMGGIVKGGGDGGGGGGTYVTNAAGNPIVVAGGGGGATSYGNAYNVSCCPFYTDGSLTSTCGHIGSGCCAPGNGLAAVPGGCNGQGGQGYGAGAGLYTGGICSAAAFNGAVGGNTNPGGYGGGSGTATSCGGVASGGGGGGGYSGGGASLLRPRCAALTTSSLPSEYRRHFQGRQSVLRRRRQLLRHGCER